MAKSFILTYVFKNNYASIKIYQIKLKIYDFRLRLLLRSFLSILRQNKVIPYEISVLIRLKKYNHWNVYCIKKTAFKILEKEMENVSGKLNGELVCSFSKQSRWQEMIAKNIVPSLYLHTYIGIATTTKKFFFTK